MLAEEAIKKAIEDVKVKNNNENQIWLIYQIYDWHSRVILFSKTLELNSLIKMIFRSEIFKHNIGNNFEC